MATFISSDGTFYDKVWTQSLDDKFLESLQFEAEVERRALNTDDHQILKKVQVQLSKYAKHKLRYHDIYNRFVLANIRYTTWEWLIKCEEVHYNAIKFTVSASEEFWESICQQHEIGIAYRKDPTEVMWNELNAIFGPDSARAGEPMHQLTTKTRRDTSKIRGNELPTIDELLMDYENEKQRAAEFRGKRGKTTGSPDPTNLPPDVMSSTKEPGKIILYTYHRITSVEYNRDGGPDHSETIGSSCTAKRCLDF